MGRSSALALSQNEHLSLLLPLASFLKPASVPVLPAPTRSADSIHPSQIKMFGPATRLFTALGGRWQKVQTVSRFRLREPQIRLHQVPPALFTICWTL